VRASLRAVASCCADQGSKRQLTNPGASLTKALLHLALLHACHLNGKGWYDAMLNRGSKHLPANPHDAFTRKSSIVPFDVGPITSPTMAACGAMPLMRRACTQDPAMERGTAARSPPEVCGSKSNG